MNNINLLQDLLLQQYSNDSADESCGCGRGLRHVKCNDCFRSPPTCRYCFSERHLQLPFHWALVWNPETGHYIKLDYSKVLPNVPNEAAAAAIRLGHDDNNTSCPSSRSNISFTVVHSNGIHSTLARFCECPRAKDRITQLMQARLFPGTILDPKTAFTFDVLKEFSMHNLQSKCGAFDYMKSLRRLTNNAATETVAVRARSYYSIPNAVLTFLLESVQTPPSSRARLGILNPEEESRAVSQHRPPLSSTNTGQHDALLSELPGNRSEH